MFSKIRFKSKSKVKDSSTFDSVNLVEPACPGAPEPSLAKELVVKSQREIFEELYKEEVDAHEQEIVRQKKEDQEFAENIVPHTLDLLLDHFRGENTKTYLQFSLPTYTSVSQCKNALLNFFTKATREDIYVCQSVLVVRWDKNEHFRSILKKTMKRMIERESTV